VPVAGATLTVQGGGPNLSATTDATGFFILEDLPAPEVFVLIDGSTATNAPEGGRYTYVAKPFQTIPGQAIPLSKNGEGFNVYLPVVPADAVQTLSMTETTSLKFQPQSLEMARDVFPNIDPAMLELFSLDIAPGSAVNAQGDPVTEAFVVPVPPDRLPEPLPPTLNPSFVVSIQAPGANSFDVPAPVTFPNLDGLAPGEKSFIFSFDHDAGAWKKIGTGTVSADGLTLEADPGVGILAPGWHFTFSGSQNFNLASSNNGDKDYATYTPGPLDIPGLLVAEASLAAPLAVAGIGNVFLEVAQLLGAPVGDFTLTVSHLAHFLGNSGTPIFYPDGSDASNLAEQDPSHNLNRQIVLNEIKQKLDARIASDPCDTSNIPLNVSNASNITFQTTDLFFAIAGTQGINVAGFADVVGNQYVGEVTFTYADTYGYGRDDANSFAWPDRPARELQEAGWAQPFRVDVEITEDFALPANISQQCASASASSFALLANDVDAMQISTARGFGSDPQVYYRFEMGNGLVLNGVTNSSRVLEGVFVTPNTEYQSFYYQPSSNRSTINVGKSGPSGSVFGFGRAGAEIFLEEFGGPDTDGDGLPDVGEKAIGTNPNSADSDGDGITDDAEITQGLDPLDNRGFPTGIISSLPLPGPATDIVVEGSTAYIATGSHGLAIVDVSRFNNPILLGQMDLTGTATDVDVDAALGLAAVTTGTGGVQIVDISDPMMPEIATVRTNILGSRVEVADGVAYVSVGNSLNAIDLLTGDVLETINVGGGTITDVVQEGPFLYTMDSGRRLQVIDITSGMMISRGSVVLPDGGGRLFVGNGIAYAAAANTTQGGFATADVSNPDAPTVISGIDAPIESAPGTALVTNGSGIGLLVGQSQRVVGDPSSLQLVNVTDPANTYALLAEIGLPAPPSAVTVASGIGFIADGTAGLQVVNYLPFDVNGQPPTVLISTSVADVDPATDGIQVLEGTSIPVQAAVTDDVQVRNVELLVDGTVVRNDVSFPFDFFALAPSIAGGAGSITLQVRATDTGGNVALSNLLTIDLVPDTFPPQLVSIDPADGAVRFEGHRTVRIQFSEPMATSGITTANLTLMEAGDDGLFDTADDTPVVIENIQLRGDDTLLQLTTAPLAIGNYRFQLNQSNVTDRAGNPLGTGNFVSHFTTVEFTGPISMSNNTTGIVDASSTTRSVTFAPEDFGGATTVLDVNVTIDFMKHDGQSFGVHQGGCTYNNEIVFALQSPSGTSVTFIPAGTYTGCTFGGRVLVTYDDEAAIAANGVPTAGLFQPAQPLTVFDGEDGVGTWTVTLQDTVGADALSFWSVTVELNSPDLMPLTLQFALIAATTQSTSLFDSFEGDANEERQQYLKDLENSLASEQFWRLVDAPVSTERLEYLSELDDSVTPAVLAELVDAAIESEEDFLAALESALDA
jgi:hypothetical protein